MKNDFVIQFENEEKLPHTVLKNVKYYDEEEDMFCNAVLELFGHSRKTTIYKPDGNIRKENKSVTSKHSEIIVRILQKDMDGSVLTIQDDKYIMDLENTDVVIEFYNELNKDFINNRINIKNMINKTVLELIENEALYGMLSNYFEEVSSYFFMNFKLIAGFESILEDQDNEVSMFFISTEQLRQSITKTIERKEGKNTWTYKSIENQELITDYKEQYFDFLVDILKQQLEIQDNSVAVYITYKLLLEAAKRYFANSWETEYGSYFSDISEFSIAEATNRYLSIETINPKNLETAGAFIYYLMINGKFESNNYLDCYEIIVDMIEKCDKCKKTAIFAERLKNRSEPSILTIDSIDIMDGYEFENFVADLFNKMGYATIITKASGDQGVDVIAEKNGIRIGIQAKCYSGKVPNSAIQQVVAGISYHNCKKGIVVTNSYFTESAKEIANSNNIVLWDRLILKEKIRELY